MAVLGHGQDVVTAAGHGREVSLSLADLPALEEIDTAEVVQRFVNNVLVAKHTRVAITTGIQTALRIEGDREVLRLILAFCCYGSASEINDIVSRHVA